MVAEKLKVPATTVSGTRNNTPSLYRKVEEDHHKEIFWMRDPKTGYWIPENQFDAVDVVELREKHLSKQ